jgi:hypothetical protein
MTLTLSFYTRDGRNVDYHQASVPGMFRALLDPAITQMEATS